MCEIHRSGRYPVLRRAVALGGAVLLLNGPVLAGEAGQAGAKGGASPEDEAFLKELEAATAPPSSATPGGGTEPPGAAGAARNFNNGLTNIFNPAMSVNGLFLAGYTSSPEAHDAEEEAAGARIFVQNEEEGVATGIGIQEIEFQFLANVDPYFGANLTASMEGGEGLSVEEGFLTVTRQPANLALRFGKLKVPFGRESALHTHALPFVDRSMIGGEVFGEGLGEVGLEASWLAPLPFYSLLTVSALNGDNENLFAAPDGRDLAYFAGWKNLFDLTDDTTLELGLSYAAGKNADALLSQVAGAHLVLKWKPARAATTRSAVAVIEALYAHRPAPSGSASAVQGELAGGYAYLQWQLARRWHIAGRFDLDGLPTDFAAATRKESLILTLAPTEFSALRLQASAYQPPTGEEAHFEAMLQADFTLGAHPAHAY